MDSLNQETLKRIIERLDDEPINAYKAFLTFLNLSFEERLSALDSVAQKLGISKASVNNYKQNYDWDNRFARFEAHKFTLEFEEKQEITKADRIKVIQQNKNVKDDAHSIATDMMGMAKMLLGKALKSDEVIETGFIIDEHGRSVPTKTQINIKSKVSDIPILAKTAVLIMRMVNDLPTETIETTIPVSADIENMTTEEIEMQMEENRKKLSNLSNIQYQNQSIN